MKFSFFEKQKHFAVIFILGIVLFAAPLMGQQVINTRTWQTYTAIQTAINAASDGDIILAYPGTYNENITVNKSVAIIGADPGRTAVIDGRTYGDVITITADRAMVKSFTIKSRTTVNYTCVKIAAGKVSVIGNNIKDCKYGIYAESGSNDTQIKENDLKNCNFAGVRIVESNNNIVYNNYVHDLYRGLWIKGTHNVLSNNTIRNFGNEGILMWGADSWIYSNIIGYLNSSRGAYGICLMSAASNVIMANTIRGSDKGIFFFDSSNNKIHHNNFIDNTCHAAIETRGVPISINNWDNGYGGNYWSGYTGPDLDNDGIIDNPNYYPIPDENCTGEKDQGTSPLVNIWGPIPGNVNGSPDGVIDMSDVSFLISYLANGNDDAIPVPPCVGDVNGDGKVYDDPNVTGDGDIDYLVDFLYVGGPAPVANCCFFLVLPRFFN